MFQLNFKSEGNKRHIFVAFSPELTQTVTNECILLLIAANRETE